MLIKAIIVAATIVAASSAASVTEQVSAFHWNSILTKFFEIRLKLVVMNINEYNWRSSMKIFQFSKLKLLNIF